MSVKTYCYNTTANERVHWHWRGLLPAQEGEGIVSEERWGNPEFNSGTPYQ